MDEGSLTLNASLELGFSMVEWAGNRAADFAVDLATRVLLPSDVALVEWSPT